MTRRENDVLQERFVVPFVHPGVAPVASTGLITCATNANMADGDYVTLNDGFSSVLYEYDKSANGVTAGRENWAVGAGSAATVAATLKTAIEAKQKAFTVTDNLDGTLTVTHKWPGSGGNATITENVTHASFTVTGMTGGVDAASHNATVAYKIFAANRNVRLEKVQYVNPTGLAGHASNYWELAVKKGSTVMAQWSTATAGQGTLTANTLVALVLSATDANAVAAVDDVISIALTKFASAANLPAGGVFLLHFKYVD